MEAGVTLRAVLVTAVLAVSGCSGASDGGAASSSEHMSCERVSDAERLWNSSEQPDAADVATIAAEMRDEAELAETSDLTDALRVAADFYQASLDPSFRLDESISTAEIAQAQAATDDYFAELCGTAIW